MKLAGPWRQPDFVKLWLGLLVSGVGSQVTLLALPLTAILVLDARPAEVALLTTLGFVPSLLFSLLVGVWTDRLRRRSILIACDVGRGLLVLSVPIAAWLGTLRIEQLYVVEFLAGTLVAFTYVAGAAYLPSLVGREHLQAANAVLSTTGSAVRVGGSGAAGVLVQVLTAPIALVVDAASFAVSALCLLLIRRAEPAAVPSQRRVWSDIHEGLYIVLASRLLRPLALSACAYNFFAAIFVTVFTLFMVRDLRLDPALIGLILTGGGVGAILGGLATHPLTQRFAIGPAMVGGSLTLGLTHFVPLLAAGESWLMAAVLFSGGVISGIGLVVLSVNRQTLTQHLAPEHALGRVFASQQFLVIAAVPLGSLAAGLLGEWLGLRATIAIAAIGTTLGMATLLVSPVRTLRELPALAPDEIPEPRPPDAGSHRPSHTNFSSLPLRP